MEPLRQPESTKVLTAGSVPLGSHNGNSVGREGFVGNWLALVVLVAATLFGLQATDAGAHEVPTNVIVRSYLKPADEQVELLLRVPLEAMRDVDVPLRGPGYVDIAEAGPYLNDAIEIWLANFVSIYADGDRLNDWRIDAARLSLPSDKAFASYQTAIAHLDSGQLAADTQLYRDQALLDVRLVYPLATPADDYAIDTQFARLGLQTTTVLSFIPSEGIQRIFEFSGNPGLVPLDPRWHQAFFRFVRLGIDHIMVGIDHILFVLCLIIPFRRIRPLIAIITSFTLAHSITLMASAFGLAPSVAWFPPLIESLIALSIVYMAVDNIIGTRWNRRWLIAFGFGLVHGFGFSFALGETLQFAGSHLLTSLLAFNIGVEIGQLVIIAFAVPLLAFAFRKPSVEKTGTIVLSALLAHSGWHWLTDRATQLTAYRYSLPQLDAAFAAALMRWAMLSLVIGLTVWVLFKVFNKLSVSGTDGPTTRAAG